MNETENKEQVNNVVNEDVVEIFSTPSCHFCHLAKDFFTENNIKYVDHDVSVDVNKAREMIMMTGQRGVPVIKIKDDIIIGFNEPKLRELLNIATA